MNLSVRSIHAILWCDCVGRGRASIISAVRYGWSSDDLRVKARGNKRLILA